ncbi:serine-threonine protein kinase [Streptomyces sp. NPDC003300]|uniref:serine-threonine protein kinase n=1 Tax=Streptomyces sp. NPDC003300 TaxID=3154446 RepID=UPI0033B6F4B0
MTGTSVTSTSVTSVRPYWDLTFDADGDPDPRQRDALLEAVGDRTDLVVFSHGWNNDIATATALYDGFFGHFPGLLAAAPDLRFGYVGVHWPSMRFSDEPIPDFPRTSPTLAAPVADGAAASGAALDPLTRAALGEVFPGSGPTLDRIAELLAERPEAPERLDEFAALVRTLTGLPPSPGAAAQGPAAQIPAARGPGAQGVAAQSLLAEDMGTAPGAEPLLFTQDPVTTCLSLADALATAGAEVAPAQPVSGEAVFGGLGRRVWDGAKELLRQATYYAMKRRAGTVGQRGLGPLLGVLARRAPSVRVHLIGHSFGARLVSFALDGMPSSVRVSSVTLLQGALSHYAFSGPQPFDARGGALHGRQQRVTGPLVACHSRHDQALGVFYPLASRLAGEDESLLGDIAHAGADLLGFGERWGALGHDGFQALDGAPELTLERALAGGLPRTGCVSVDASSVVCSGGPPSGAHSDICHEELARLVLRAAGRVPG